MSTALCIPLNYFPLTCTGTAVQITCDVFSSFSWGLPLGHDSSSETRVLECQCVSTRPPSLPPPPPTHTLVLLRLYTVTILWLFLSQVIKSELCEEFCSLPPIRIRCVLLIHFHCYNFGISQLWLKKWYTLGYLYHKRLVIAKALQLNLSWGCSLSIWCPAGRGRTGSLRKLLSAGHVG